MIAAMPVWVWWLLLAENAATFVVYGWDKLCARRGWRRIAEAHLLWLLFVGGVVGAWAAMTVFRHKTVKSSFRWRAIALTVLNPVWLVLWQALRP